MIEVAQVKKTIKHRFLMLVCVMGLSAAGVLSGNFDSLVKRVNAAPPVQSAPLALQAGDVSGFAWMGQTITDPDSEAQGGGGWLSMNCRPTDCDNGNWGVKMDVTDGPNKGVFSGEAWSSNYGWLTFEEDIADSCWRNNPFAVVQNSARAYISEGLNTAPIRGWAKFTAGDDVEDGWDGCVSFNGINNQVSLDMTTGVINGWAWGGPVVGWVSFTNPECPFCDTSVVLPTVPNLTFWATDTTVVSGGGTALNWTSEVVNGNYVSVCSQYNNTSGYNHWRDNLIFGMLSAVGEISYNAGNLPNGSHPINNISQTTTYSITCADRFGNVLPTRYATVTVVEPCRDPSASNFGGALPCVYTTPSIDLTVITNHVPNDTMPANSTNPFDYQVSPRWVFTERNLVVPNSCQQFFTDENNVAQNLTGWTGAQLANPPYAGNNPSDPSGNSSLTTTNISQYANDAAPGSVFTFSIRCNTTDGGFISDSAIVRIVNAVVVNPSPSLQLFAENPTIIIGSGNYDEKLWWSSNDPSELDSCRGSFARTSPGLQNINLVGWSAPGTANVPDPNMSQNPGYTAHQNSFNTIAGNVSVPSIYRFTITCEDNGGGPDVSASTSIQFVNTPISTEPPYLELIIKQPDTNPVGPYQEVIPATGWDQPGSDQFTLKWSALNVNGCTARSEQFVGSNMSPVGNNSDWQGQGVPDDGDPSDSSQVEKSFPILGSAIKNTIFYIENCIPDDVGSYGSAPLSPARVCLGITGQPFPQCTVTGPGRIPSYIEI